MKLSTHPTKLFTHWFFATIFFCITSLQIDAQKLAVIHYATVPLVSNVFSPIDIKTCGDDRLFIVDKGGLIRIVNADSTTRTTPFLDFSSKVYQASEDGFLGMVFSPNYKTDGKFYVDYTSKVSGVVTTFIDQYTVSAADSNVADLSSELNILSQSQPFDNHLGGNLMFGQDGYLYINFGDGDAEGDPNGYGQDTTTWEGKILRLDVSNSSMAQPYVIPPTNPFFNDPTPGIKKEIWAYGVRNPWRSSVDRLTGDLWIADVGQDSVEEVDYQPLNAVGGRNYGWNTMEGNACYNPHTGCNMTGLTLPIYAYPHSIGATVIGGYVDRSAQSKSLFGMYIFGDFTKKFIAGFRQSGGVLSGPVTQLIPAAQATSTGRMIDFGEDRFGDQYILFNGDGRVYSFRIQATCAAPKHILPRLTREPAPFHFRAYREEILLTNG
jgi:glucose/arabinose dehydrogenase